jgi:hypothetical protein
MRRHLDVNVENNAFEVTDALLAVSAERGPEDFAWSIFDVCIDLNVTLDKRLNLNYSLCASQLDLSTDQARIYLNLINGTHTILLFYVIGFRASDLIPDPAAEEYSYVFYQVGNSTKSWFTGKRNLWTDLTDKSLSLMSSWKIVKIIFGVKSYAKRTEVSNHRIEGVFDLTGNSLHYEDSIFAKLSPGGLRVSWFFVTGGIIIIFLSVIVSRVAKASETATERRGTAKGAICT